MEGHILPVIYSWHVGVKINEVAGSFHGALDPEKFFVAWDRGAAVTGDFFARDWDFFATAPAPIDELRAADDRPPTRPVRSREPRRHRRPRLPPHRLTPPSVPKPVRMAGTGTNEGSGGQLLATIAPNSARKPGTSNPTIHMSTRWDSPRSCATP